MGQHHRNIQLGAEKAEKHGKGKFEKGKVITCNGKCGLNYELTDSKGSGVVTKKPSTDTINLEK